MWKSLGGTSCCLAQRTNQLGGQGHQAFQSLSLSSLVTMVSQILKHLDKAAIPGVSPEELDQMAVQGTTSANAPRANGTGLAGLGQKSESHRVDSIHTLWFLYSCGLLVFLLCVSCANVNSSHVRTGAGIRAVALWIAFFSTHL